MNLHLAKRQNFKRATSHNDPETTDVLSFREAHSKKEAWGAVQKNKTLLPKKSLKKRKRSSNMFSKDEVE